MAHTAYEAWMNPWIRGAAGFVAGRGIAGSIGEALDDQRLQQHAAIRGATDYPTDKDAPRLEAIKARRHMGDYASSLDKRSSAAYEFGQKLAALDASKLPPGVEYPDPYTLRWRTPAGNTIEHQVSDAAVNHAQGVEGDSYYNTLAKNIAARTSDADREAPELVNFRKKTDRITHATLGGLGGALVGSGIGSLLKKPRPGMGSLIGLAGGATLGALAPVDQSPNITFEHGTLSGGEIPGLYVESPEEKRVKQLHRDMRRLHNDVYRHPRIGHYYDPYYPYGY